MLFFLTLLCLCENAQETFFFFFPLHFAFKRANSITSARQRQLLLICRWIQTHQTCWCWADVNVTVSSPVFLFYSLILSFFGLFWHFLIILCVCVCVCRRCGRVGASCSPTWSRRTPSWTSWSRNWTRRTTCRGERRSCRRRWMWVEGADSKEEC